MNKIKLKTIFTSLFIILILAVIATSIFFGITRVEKLAKLEITSAEQYSENLYKNKSYKNARGGVVQDRYGTILVNYGGNTSTGQISYENYRDAKDLIIPGISGRLMPWRLFGSGVSYISSRADVQRKYASQAALDATKESWETNVTTRTLSTYTLSRTLELTNGLAYILAHDKETGYDIPKVQYAVYKYNGIRDAILKQRIGMEPEDTAHGEELYNEAKEFDDASKANNKITDNMVSKYSDGTAGVVSYQEEYESASGDIVEAEFLIGPFSINYDCKIKTPTLGTMSEAAENDGTVVYNGIVGAELKGLVNGSVNPTKITNWEFVYTDVTYNASTGKARRNSLAYDDDGNALIGLDKSKYPQANEIFYIRLPKSDNVSAITSLTFTMQTLKAEAKVSVYTGTFTEQVNGRTVTVNSEPLYKIEGARIYKDLQDVTIELGVAHNDYTPDMTKSAVYKGRCIPLTMPISGNVWLDGNEVAESNRNTDGKMDAKETKLSDTAEHSLIAALFEVGGAEPIATTRVENGKYTFKYVPAGRRYYVEFAYDLMKYKTVSPLYKLTTNGGNKEYPFGDNFDKYTNDNSDDYLLYSHVAEDNNARIKFNESFYEITTNKAISADGKKTTNMNYGITQSEQGQVSKVQQYSYSYEKNAKNEIEFPASTTNVTSNGKTLIYPLQENYTVTNQLLQSATGQTYTKAAQNSNMATIGALSGGNHYVVRTNPNSNSAAEAGTKTVTTFVRAGNYLANINMGLIERNTGDFAIKTDIVETQITHFEYGPYINLADFSKKNMNSSGFELSDRVTGYYNTIYTQKINNADYIERWNSVQSTRQRTQNDELQLFVTYKMRILNQSQLLQGEIAELAAHYDSEYYYPVNSNEKWKYYDENINYERTNEDYSQRNGYYEVMEGVMSTPSWAIKYDKNGNIVQDGINVNWYSKSKYNTQATDTMYTTSLGNIKLEKDQYIDVYVMFKVKRTEDTNLGEGLYLINDNNDNGKEFTAEINGYRVYNYDGTRGGGVDCDSNPGNVNIKDSRTYEDDADRAPFLRVVVDLDNPRGITGYVWEDARIVTQKDTNMIVGNGKRDENESLINNVKVEIVPLVLNKLTGEYEETKFNESWANTAKITTAVYTGPQRGSDNSLSATDNGQYRFTNLPEGEYKVRFTYGTEEQLNNAYGLDSTSYSLKYNGHDYKSTEFEGLLNYNNEAVRNLTEIPDLIGDVSTRVVMLYSNDESLVEETQYRNEFMNELEAKLRGTHSSIQIERIKLDKQNNTLDNVYTKIKQTSESNKILVFITDGVGINSNNAKVLLSEMAKNIYVYGVGLGSAADYSMFAGGNNQDGPLYCKLFASQTAKENAVINVYNYIADLVVNSTVLISNGSHATDYLADEERKLSGDDLTNTVHVDGRADVMKYSQVIDANKARDLDIEYMSTLNRESNEWKELVGKLALNTQMTADSYPMHVNFTTDIKTVNLGLQEIPKSEIELEAKVSNVIIKLQNNEEIINQNVGRTDNLQVFPNDKYIAYLDKEIMQGATVQVEYSYTIKNVGEVDNFYTYLRYYPDAKKQEFYSNVTGRDVSGLTGNNLNAELRRSIPVKVNKLYDYYDRLSFRAEDNIRNLVNKRKVELNESEGSIPEVVIDINTGHARCVDYDRTGDIYDAAVRWDAADSAISNTLYDGVYNGIDARGYNSLTTTGLSGINIYPAISKDVQNGENAAVTTYLTLTKTISSKDLDVKGMLEYKNFAEIIEIESNTGRRSYIGKVGNYVAGDNTKEDTFASKDTNVTKVTEIDADRAEQVILLPPFGATLRNYVAEISYACIVLGGIALIVRKACK